MIRLSQNEDLLFLTEALWSFMRRPEELRQMIEEGVLGTKNKDGILIQTLARKSRQALCRDAETHIKYELAQKIHHTVDVLFERIHTQDVDEVDTGLSVKDYQRWQETIDKIRIFRAFPGLSRKDSHLSSVAQRLVRLKDALHYPALHRTSIALGGSGRKPPLVYADFRHAA